jgi:CRISPR-associated protein Csm1
MYLPYVAPKDEDGDLLTFEDIANLSTGNKKLAMFKADIDNLGLVFSQSLGDRMSFSRYADLSHMLHYFFSSFYAWFVNSKTDQYGKLYKERIYTVFSGGDDLCILGSWDTVLQFALDFRKALAKFTNNNPFVTISGGITLVISKVPVRNIADEAEELLEKSKAKDGKNAITVFGTTVSWEEYEKCLEDGKFLQEQLKLNKTDSKKGVSTGVIYKFLDFANRAEKILGNKDDSKIADVSELINMKDRIWKSNMIYVVTRNVKNNEEAKKKLLDFGANPQSMVNSRIAVSYALYTQR